MKRKLLLIRHGKTKGNLEGRYIGKNTDESLCEEGINELRLLEKNINLWLMDANFTGQTGICVYTGSMKRCVETAELLFPSSKCIVVDGLTEIDFGDFENKNYNELNGNQKYQDWIDSGGKNDYPNGEKLVDFIQRSLQSFYWVIDDMKKRDVKSACIICHGGNIMSIMSELTGKEYFDFQVKNGSGIELEIEDSIEEKCVDIVSYCFV